MKILHRKILALLGVLTLLLSSCATPSQTHDKLQVATTSFALQYFIEAIAGDYVDVTYSLKGNPHHFELTQSDAGIIAHADIFMNVDVGDYRAIGKQIRSINKNMTIVDLSQGTELLESNHSHTDGTTHGETNQTALDVEQMDPHLWLDPIQSKILVENILVALQTADAEHSAAYAANAQVLQDQLTALDTFAINALAPATRNDFLVSHGAYTYLAERYNLEQTSVNSNSDHGENTQQSIITLDAFIDTHGITTIFIEENLETNNVINILIAEKKLKTDFLNNIETQLSPTDDYFTLMEQNITALSQSLI